MARARVGRRTRHLLVFVHVAVSVGWMGAGAANVVLSMTAAHATGDLELQRYCYLLIDRIDLLVVIPAAFAALVSGVVLALVTPWGLARHWWVLTKLVLTIVVILYSTFGVGVWVLQSIEATAAGAARSPVALPLAWGAVANIAAFLFMTWASVAKPWGTTPWAGTARGTARGTAGGARRSRPGDGGRAARVADRRRSPTVEW